jgi:hypothetical protein
MDKKRMQDGAYSFVFDRLTMTHPRQRFCARLLNSHNSSQSAGVTAEPILGLRCKTKVSNSDQLLFRAWAIIM